MVVLQKITGLIKRLLRVSCLLCGNSTPLEKKLCVDCLALLPTNIHACQRCSEPLPDDVDGLCGRCIQQEPLFDRCIAPLRFDYPVNLIVHAFKFKDELGYISPITDVLWEHVSQRYENESMPQVLIPVPLHIKRLRQRGYNQAELIAKRLSSRSKIPLLKNAVKRIRYLRPQQGLARDGRYKNIRRSFSIVDNIACQHVALIDDVVTTGATVAEITRVLKQSGVKRVDVWCLARTPLD